MTELPHPTELFTLTRYRNKRNIGNTLFTSLFTSFLHKNLKTGATVVGEKNRIYVVS